MDPSELVHILRENSQFLLILGIIVVTASLVLHLRKRHRAEAERQAQRRAEIKAAQEAERKRQIQRGERVKTNPTTSPDRMPLTDPYDATFTGSSTPKNLAKWEAEIHQIGRQMIGQIDSKMVALQVLTLEANRVANRLEILVDHLENLVVPHVQEDIPTEKHRENKINLPETISKTSEENSETLSTEQTPRLISAESLDSAAEPVQMEAFADILDDLESELDQFHEESTRWRAEPVEQALPATILKASELSEKAISQIRDSERLSVSASSDSQNAFSLSSPRLPGDLFVDLPSNVRLKAERKVVSAESLSEPTRQTTLRRQSNALSIDSLYESRSNSQPEKTLPPGVLFDEKTPTIKGGSRLALRKQVEMLADYGYTANQIAQNLNITVGEVDLMLSLRN